MTTNNSNYLSNLNELLNRHFNLEEFRSLCFDLDVDYDSLRGEGKAARIRELLINFSYTSQLPKLIVHLRQIRSQIQWASVPEDIQLPTTLLSGWDGRIPYLGLTAFRENDAQFFFGREHIVEKLLSRVQQSTFVIISGSSGSGKSSVARAGLFNALKENRIPNSHTWLRATMQPKRNPIEQLAQSLERATKSPHSGDYVRQQGKENALALHEQVETLLSDDLKQRCILLVDQFEEIFTQTQDEESRTTFINLLTTAAQAENGRTIIVISLRSDFISHCDPYPDLEKHLNRQFQYIGNMKPQELIQAIARPALEVGAAIDPALGSQIVSDMGNEPGTLPLMSFALRDLFEAEATEKGKPLFLTKAKYLERGGIYSVLEQYANRIFAEFSDAQLNLVRKIFIKLVDLNDEERNTRRIATLQELVSTESDPAETTVILRELSQEGTRLITIDGSTGEIDASNADTTHITVTLAHEKLIDAWPWLRNLVNKNREIIALQNQIRDDAQEWEKQKDRLYPPSKLLQVEESLKMLQPTLDTLSQHFIEANQAQKVIREQEEAERIRKEEALKQEQINANRFRRLTRRLAVAVVISVVASLVAFFFLNQSIVERDRVSQSQATAVAAQVTADVDRATAVAAQATSDVQAIEANLAAGAESQAKSTAISAEATAQFDKNQADIARATAIAAQSETEKQRRLILAQSLAFQALDEKTGNHDSELRTLLALEAHRINREANGNLQALIDSSLRTTLSESFYNHTLQGHIDDVLSVAISPDNQWLASSSEDKTVQLWNINSPTTSPSILKKHTDIVQTVAFSPDGKTLATGSKDKTIYLWNVEAPLTNEPIPIEGHRMDEVSSVAFSPNGQWLAVISFPPLFSSNDDDSAIHLWNLQDLESEPFILEKPSGKFFTLAFSPDGQRLVAGGRTDRILVWNIDTPTASPVSLINESDSSFLDTWSIAFSPDGQTLATVSGIRDYAIRLWNLASSTPTPTRLEGHTDIVRTITFSPDGQWLASGSDDKTARLWNLTDSNTSTVLYGHEDTVESVAFSHNGLWLASGSLDNSVRLWNLFESPASSITLKKHFNWVFSVAFSPNSHVLAIGDGNGIVCLFNLLSFDCSGNEDNHTRRVKSVAFSSDGQWLASGSDDKTIILQNLVEPIGKEVHIFSSIQSVAFSPNGQWLASGAVDGTVTLWDLTESTLDSTHLKEHSSSVNSVAFSSDGQWLASASSDNTIRLWDITDPALNSTILYRGQVSIDSVAFSPDSKSLAFGGADGDIQIWDLYSNNSEPEILEGHTALVRSIAFSPDGQWLASGSADHTIRLWHISTVDIPSVTLEGHADEVLSVSFSPDGQWLASGSADTTSRLWPTLPKLIELGCLTVWRNLTQPQWQQYLGEEVYQTTCTKLPITS